MKNSLPPIATSSLPAPDGTLITYTQTGQGPGLVIVPGSMCTATDYARLAENLAATHTVYVVNRRGHGSSGPIAAGHSMATECQDIAAVLAATQARRLFGHSIGGLISLRTALATPLDKLAVYEPPLSINGSIPTAWVPAMQQALAQRHYARAMAIIMKNLQLSSDAGALPTPVLTLVIALMMRLRRGHHGEDAWGRHIIKLLPTMPTDIGLVREMDSTADQLRPLTTPTLLVGGAKSASHFQLALQTLAQTLPHAQSVSLPGLEHNAPNQDDPDAVARQLLEFFSS